MRIRRTEIRRRICALIANSIEEFEGRVFAELVTPVWTENLPACCFYLRSEEVSELNGSPKELRRSLTVAVEIKAKGLEPPQAITQGKDPVAEILDCLSRKVELALMTDDSLGEDGLGNCVADKTTLISTEYEFEPNGDQVVGSVRLGFIIMYAEFAPENVKSQGVTADLDTVGVDWHIGHDSGPPDKTDIEAQDEIDYT